MGQKAETLLNEFFIGTGFLSGFWVTMEFNPKYVLIEQLGKAIAIIGTQETASDFMLYARLIILAGTLVAIVGTYSIGRKLGIVGLVVMFFAGLLFLNATAVSILLMVLAMFLGALAVEAHTDEQAFARQPQTRRAF